MAHGAISEQVDHIIIGETQELDPIAYSRPHALLERAQKRYVTVFYRYSASPVYKSWLSVPAWRGVRYA
jgi:hypothetical protein